MPTSNILCSPFGVGVSHPPKTKVPRILWERLKRFSHWKDSIVMTCGRNGTAYTFANIEEKSKNLGINLRQVLKLGNQDRVMVMLPNCIDYVVIVLGVLEAGCVASLVNPAYKKDELDHIFKIVSPTSVICCLDRLPDILVLKEQMSCISTIVILDGKQPSAYSYEELVQLDNTALINSQEFLEDDIDMEDTALILYSSGTTGLPKAVMLSHLNICSSLMQQAESGEHYIMKPYIFGQEQETLLVPLPLFHVFGFQTSLLYSLYQGAHVVVLPDFGRELLLSSIRKYKPTIWEVVPPMMKFFVNSQEITSEDFSSVRILACGAAPLGETIERKFELKFPGVKLIQVFGLTETTAIILSCSAVNPIYTKPGSIGALLPGAFGKIVDLKNGSELGPNQTGELLLKGNQVVKGYMNNEEATRGAIDQEGWLHTGDIAKYDTDGCFYIVDRLKDIIKYKGFQVSPSEIENILRQIPSVIDAAVVGVTSKDEYEELPKAFVVKRDKLLTDLEVIHYVQERVTDYKRLRGGVEFVDKIPVSAAGKILRKDLNRKRNVWKRILAWICLNP